MRKVSATGVEWNRGIETEQTKVLIEFIFIKMSSQQTPPALQAPKNPQNPQTIGTVNANPGSCLLAAMSLLTLCLFSSRRRRLRWLLQ